MNNPKLIQCWFFGNFLVILNLTHMRSSWHLKPSRFSHLDFHHLDSIFWRQYLSGVIPSEFLQPNEPIQIFPHKWNSFKCAFAIKSIFSKYVFKTSVYIYRHSWTSFQLNSLKLQSAIDENKKVWTCVIWIGFWLIWIGLAWKRLARTSSHLLSTKARVSSTSWS